MAFQFCKNFTQIDRVYDEHVGRKIKALYENGWEVGEITNFNSVLKEYRVSFTDGSEGYIQITDIDGVYNFN